MLRLLVSFPQFRPEKWSLLFGVFPSRSGAIPGNQSEKSVSGKIVPSKNNTRTKTDDLPPRPIFNRPERKY
jgi:hypothetical protein